MNKSNAHSVESLKNAIKSLSVADKMLTQTFKMLQDPKILVAVLENVFQAFKFGIISLFQYDESNDFLSTIKNNFQIIFEEFQINVAKKYSLGEFIKLIDEIQMLRSGHKDASVEFSKKEIYVMCSQDYDCEVLSDEKLRKFIKEAKLFIKRLEKIMLKNG
jgi:hypothetical protein